MKLRITYVDGEQIDLAHSDWPDARRDGVDRIELMAPGGPKYALMGHSIYWCRDKDGLPIFGGGTVGVVDPDIAAIEEIHFTRGRFYRSRPRTMPDLRHSMTKLGWWL